MRFAALVLFAGFIGTALASNLQGPAITSGPGLTAAMQPSPDTTASVPPPPQQEALAIRLIDLRNGATCRIAAPAALGPDFRRVPITPDCGNSPELSRVAYWRSSADGTLIMADGAGETVLRFQPGDGVLFESVYPETAMITIVPARG